jgi:hypothetical protein
MRAGPVTVRAAALMAAAALVLHELRYLLGYESGAGHALEQQGHGYLSFAGVVVALLLTLATAQLLARVARAWRDGRVESQPHSLGVAWAAAATGLVLIYSCQELLEGLLSAGHPDGLAGVIDHGGAWVVPLATVLGGIVALLLHGAVAAVRAAAAAGARRRAAHRPRPQERPRWRHVFPSASPIARHLAGRAPPLLH